MNKSSGDKDSMWRNKNFDDDFNDVADFNEYQEYFSKKKNKRHTSNLGSIFSYSNRITTGDKKCKYCRMPIQVKEDWKDSCRPCYAKNNGTILNCKGCNKKIPVLDYQFGDNYCVECYKKKNGIGKTCTKCNETYYVLSTSKYDLDLQSKCLDCFLKTDGIMSKCTICKCEMRIKKDEKPWKKKCYDCWLSPNKP